MLIIKTFHVFFVVSWFACLFYLPRLFVNHATSKTDESHELFVGMESRLIKMMEFTLFGTLVSAVLLVYVLASDYLLSYITLGWFISKIILVFCLIFYHVWCIKIHKQFIAKKQQKSHVWFRWFNEMPVFLLFAVIYLVLAKPF